MVADVTDLGSCLANPPEPRALFDGLEEELWDVHPSGDLFITVDPLPHPELRLIQNWLEELKAKVGN